ncbi:MAG: hypothetical protein WCB70_00040, partial [Xanthobacteraceae bacterium]
IRCVSLHLNDRIILFIRRYAVRIKVEIDQSLPRRPSRAEAPELLAAPNIAQRDKSLVAIIRI